MLLVRINMYICTYIHGYVVYNKLSWQVLSTYLHAGQSQSRRNCNLRWKLIKVHDASPNNNNNTNNRWKTSWFRNSTFPPSIYERRRRLLLLSVNDHHHQRHYRHCSSDQLYRLKYTFDGVPSYMYINVHYQCWFIIISREEEEETEYSIVPPPPPSIDCDIIVVREEWILSLQANQKWRHN